jgi:hypothetical protein
MSEQDQATLEGGIDINADNIAAIREELSGGFSKAQKESQLPPQDTAPTEADQPQGEGQEGGTSNDSIGLSDDEKPSTDDASKDRGEASGDSNADSAATPASEEAPTEDENSPFSTEEDLGHDEEIIDNPTDEVVNDDEYFDELSDQIGYDVTSDDDVIDLVRHLSEKDPLEGLSPLMRQAAEFEKNGGDIREYFNVLSVNTENLSDKDAMWHKFKTENSSLAQENGEFAKQKFERDFKTKYKILSDTRTEDDFDSIEEYNAFQNDKGYASEELKYEAQLAKQTLANTREEALKTAPPQVQVNEEEQRAVYEKYQDEANYYKSNFETLQIPIDAEGKTSYNIGLNEKSRPMYEKWMDNPSEFLDYIGIGSDQKSINTEALAAHVALTAAFAVDGEFSVGAQFANAMTERLNRNSVETRLENPNPEGGRASSGVAGGDELQEAIEALRGGVMKDRRK